MSSSLLLALAISSGLAASAPPASANVTGALAKARERRALRRDFKAFIAVDAQTKKTYRADVGGARLDAAGKQIPISVVAGAETWAIRNWSHLDNPVAVKLLFGGLGLLGVGMVKLTVDQYRESVAYARTKALVALKDKGITPTPQQHAAWLAAGLVYRVATDAK